LQVGNLLSSNDQRVAYFARLQASSLLVFMLHFLRVLRVKRAIGLFKRSPSCLKINLSLFQKG